MEAQVGACWRSRKGVSVAVDATIGVGFMAKRWPVEQTRLIVRCAWATEVIQEAGHD